MPRKVVLDAATYVDGVRAGDPTLVARTITLVESTLPAHRALAGEVLDRLLPHTGRAHRVGLTGVPGVGKSTFVERLGLHLVESGHKVAVLAIDPSSTISGGSIMGDKTRMARLAQHPSAFIRPSPSGRTLGGVARRTRETMLIAEAAGYDVVLVETVGVGQSETVVADMVDVFVALMLAGAGDELQGIKRGLLELVDVLAVNKADGDNARPAERARREYASALHYLRPRTPDWTPVALAVSGLTGAGVPELWATLEAHRTALLGSGTHEARRREQRRAWMWSLIEERVIETFRGDPAVQARLGDLEAEVVRGGTSAGRAADALLAAYHRETSSG